MTPPYILAAKSAPDPAPCTVSIICFALLKIADFAQAKPSHFARTATIATVTAAEDPNPTFEEKVEVISSTNPVMRYSRKDDTAANTYSYGF